MKKKAYIHLIRYAAEHGAKLSVDDGDGQFVPYKTATEAISAVEAVDVAHVHFATEEGKSLGTAMVSCDRSFEPEETVIDFTVTDFLDRWEKVYYDGDTEVNEPDPKQEVLESLEKFRFHEQRVPGHIHNGIARYVVDHDGVGHFLTAVICNDLSAAISRADLDNLRNLAAVSAWFYNHAPAACWGSPEKYRAWLEVDRGSQHETQTTELEENA